MQTQSGRLPDFFIVGAAKSATTSLYAHLHNHPAVFTPFYKEPHFFSYADLAPHRFIPAVNLFQYVRLFSRARPDQIIGEASTSYLYEYRKTIEEIRQTYGAEAEKIKIIISLRNPADRAFSHYCMYRLYGLESLGFDDAVREGVFPRLDKDLDTDRFGVLIDYERAGMYYEAVKAYRDAFSQVHIVLYDDIQHDLADVMRGIFRFLDVDEDSPIIRDIPRYNETGTPRCGPFNALMNGLQKTIMTKRSRTKAVFIRIIGLFVDWDSLRGPVGSRVLRMLHTLRFMNVKKVSIPPLAWQRLTDFYRPDVRKLQELIGRDLSAWL